MNGKIIKSKKITAITSRHVNQWVVLSSDYKRVLAADKNLTDVLKKTKKTKNRVVMKVLPNLSYAPAIY